MNTLTAPKWVVDLNELTCFNIDNQMLVVFVKKGSAFEGKIKDMPVEMREMNVRNKNREKYIKNAIVEANIAFYKAYFVKEIEKWCGEAGY